MDVMQLRRNLLMQKSGVIDTSPKILEYDVTYGANGSHLEQLGFCITEIYIYETLTAQGTIAYYGTSGKNCIVYKNGLRIDYWVLNESNSPRKCVNIDSNGIAFSLNASELDNCYAYMVDTGQIFFAGKNTPYYGYLNINDMPT